MNIPFLVELALIALLALTLVYCIVLERKLSALRKGQDGLKATIGELNTAIVSAGASMRALAHPRCRGPISGSTAAPTCITSSSCAGRAAPKCPPRS